MIGLGMAAAVITDALVVRTVLVPAMMHTLGTTNWRIPRALDRLLPHLDLEDSTEPPGAGRRRRRPGHPGARSGRQGVTPGPSSSAAPSARADGAADHQQRPTVPGGRSSPRGASLWSKTVPQRRDACHFYWKHVIDDYCYS